MQPTQNKSVLIANMMQIKLAQLHGESIDSFIEKHSSDFRNIINDHPEFIDDFEKDENKALKEVGDIIYH